MIHIQSHLPVYMPAPLSLCQNVTTVNIKDRRRVIRVMRKELMSRVKQLTLGNTEPSDVGGRNLSIPDQELGGIILVSSRIISICTITVKLRHIFIEHFLFAL